jgi:hypothetical protein
MMERHGWLMERHGWLMDGWESDGWLREDKRMV